MLVYEVQSVRDLGRGVEVGTGIGVGVGMSRVGEGVGVGMGVKVGVGEGVAEDVETGVSDGMGVGVIDVEGSDATEEGCVTVGSHAVTHTDNRSKTVSEQVVRQHCKNADSTSVKSDRMAIKILLTLATVEQTGRGIQPPVEFFPLVLFSTHDCTAISLSVQTEAAR